MAERKKKDLLIGFEFEAKMGNCKLISLVGEGGMAKVYKAEAEGKTIAVKVLKGDVPVVDHIKRFQREAKIFKKFQEHRNVVEFYEYVSTSIPQGGGMRRLLHCIVMEFMDGDVLEDILIKTGRLRQQLSFRRILRVMDQVLAALDAAHQLGIIHRDVTPGNIFVLKEDPTTGLEIFVKVGDFGLAKVVSLGDKDKTLTREGVCYGTPTYMSPEQARGEQVDFRTDIYSAGVVLYHLVTGQPPFDGDTIELILKQRTAKPERPSVFRNIPPRLEGVILKAMEKDPDKRFVSALAFKEALSDALVTSSVRVSRLSSIFNLFKSKPQVKSIESASTLAAPVEQEKKVEEEKKAAKEEETEKVTTTPEFRKKLKRKPKFKLPLLIGIPFLVMVLGGIVGLVLKKIAFQEEAIDQPKIVQPVEEEVEVKAEAKPEWQVHVERGEEAAAQEEWEKAAAEFEKASELKKDDPEIWKSLGAALARLKKWKEAKTAYQKYLALKPNAPDKLYIEQLIKNW